MPLLKFNLIKGRTDQQIKELLNTAHDVMVETFQVPASDRYQCVTQHQEGEMILEDTGLGYTRTNNVVVLTVISRPRPQEQKVAFYRLLADKLHSTCALSPNDLIITVLENTDADWSFGHGRAQFLTQELF